MRFAENNQVKAGTSRRVIMPAVSIREGEREVVVETEMPGLDKEEILIETKGNELVVKGRHVQQEEGLKGYVVIHRERPEPDYERTFILSDEVDREKISAQYDNGVLTFSIAKAEKLQPKKIAII